MESIIYVEIPDGPKLKTGDILGELTNELQSYGVKSFISEFCYGGPKIYRFEVYN